MAAYLERLAARAIEPARLLQPKLPVRFGREVEVEMPPLEAMPLPTPSSPRDAAAPAAEAPARPPVMRVFETTREVRLHEPAAQESERHLEPQAPLAAPFTEAPFIDQPLPAVTGETTEPLAPRAAGPATPPVIVRHVERVKGVERVERTEAIERIERLREERELETIRVISSDRDVHVTIGRIEVRAVTAPAVVPPAPRARREPPKTQSLEEYLAQRDRERR